MAKTLTTTSWLPWARCNLYRNPFGELTRQERAKVAVVDVKALCERVRRPWTAIQFIGDCGRGKTTRMLAMSSRFPESSYVYLPEDERCPPIAEGRPVFIDEAQRLPRAVRKSIFASGVPMVLATHRNLSRPLRRSGYEVHTEWIGAGNSAELVCRLLNRRIEASRLHPGPLPQVTLQDSQQLVKRFGSNIRSIESYLYERVQLQVDQHGEMRFVDSAG